MMNTILQLIEPSIAYALGWTIIHSLWQASFIALFMSLIHKFGGSKNASFKYTISVLSMLGVFVASAITFGIYYSSSSVSTDMVAAFEMAQVPIGSDYESATLTSLQAFFTQNIDQINLIWAIGVILFLARFIFSYAYTKYLKNTAIFSNSTELENTLTRIKKNLFITKTIKIAESAKIKVPIVVGHVKPLILFPIGIVNMLSTKEVEAIIIHELAHVKRYDYITNILLTLIEILFYFHPAVWWISANVKAERENCCDDFALSQNIDKVVYAKALVKLEEMKSMGTPALAMPFSSKKHQLINRIKRIMNMPQTQSDMKEKSIATILLLSIVLLFSNQANSTSILEDSFVESEEFMDADLITEKNTFDFQEANDESEDNDVEEDDELDVDLSTKEPSNEQALWELLDDQSNAIEEDVDEMEHNYFYHMNVDTLPQKRNSTSTIVTRENGKTVEVERENGEITKLKIDGKVIPKSKYDEYEEEIESSENTYEFEHEGNHFEHFNNEDFSRSFGFLFDGEKWREFGGNMNQLFDEDILEKLQDMEGLQFDFKQLEELKGLKGLEKMYELRGLENMEEIENLNEIFEELGINLDSTFRGMKFNFDNFNDFEHYDFFNDLDNDDIRIYRGDGNGYRNGTVVDKIGRMLNKDGLLKEYKANKIEITGKHLKINGEKMPKAIFEKYKNIYQESTGAPLTKKSKMIFDVEGKPSKRKVKTF